jgi:hypothetical protein
MKQIRWGQRRSYEADLTATGKAEVNEKVVAPFMFLRNGHLSTSGWPNRFCDDADSPRKLPKNISILNEAKSNEH